MNRFSCTSTTDAANTFNYIRSLANSYVKKKTCQELESFSWQGFWTILKADGALQIQAIDFIELQDDKWQPFSVAFLTCSLICSLICSLSRFLARCLAFLADFK